MELQMRRFVQDVGRILFFWALLFLFSAGLFSNSRAQTVFKADTTQRETQLIAGDAVHLYVYDGFFPAGEDKFIGTFHDKEYIIDGFGDINLFSIGRVHVVGLTAGEIARVLETKLKPFAKDPHVVVEPLVKLYLRGGFNESGLHRFNLRISFWEMLEQVGGLNGITRIEDIYIVRDDRILYKDFWNAFYRASSLAELGIQSGDEIIAPRVNRLTMDTILRYFQFGMSIITFYITFLNYRNTQ
jgi:protein involved in polysaccharide export with SLBB domain